jgi:ATP synthase protein I
MSESNYGWIRTAGMLGSIGLLVLVSTLIGLGLGYWLDGKLGTSPWLAFALTVAGLAAGIYEAIVLLIKATRDEDG